MRLGDPYDLADLVARFYEAAPDDAAWPNAIKCLVQHFHATAGVFYLEQRDGPALMSTPGWSETALRLYAEHYRQFDPYAAFGSANAHTSAVHLGQEIVDTRAFLKGKVWQDFGRLHCPEAVHALIGISPLGDGTGLRAGLHRPGRAGEFSETDRQAMMRVMPHMRRALQMRAALARERETADLRGAALDGLSAGVVVLDSAGRVMFANAATEALARDGAIGIGRGERFLRLRSATEGATLARLVESVAAGGPGGPMRVMHEGRPYLALLVSRLPLALATRVWMARSTDHLALVLLRSLIDVPISPAFLQALYGLTATEAQIAQHLMEGLSPEAVASARGRSVATIRTQIRSILSKTGSETLRDLSRQLGALRA